MPSRTKCLGHIRPGIRPRRLYPPPPLDRTRTSSRCLHARPAHCVMQEDATRGTTFNATGISIASIDIKIINCLCRPGETWNGGPAACARRCIQDPCLSPSYRAREPTVDVMVHDHGHDHGLPQCHVTALLDTNLNLTLAPPARTGLSALEAWSMDELVAARCCRSSIA